MFDALGILFWLVAAFATYREEGTNVVTVAGNLDVAMLHLQNELLIFAGICAILGTLFLGFSAVVKAVSRRNLTISGS